MSQQFEESKSKSQATAAVFVDEGNDNRAIIAKRGSTFSHGRLATYIKSGKYAERVGAGTPVYLAAVLEYIVYEILDLAAEESSKDRKMRITPTHIMRAIKNDPELAKFIKGQFCNAGFQPKLKADLPRAGGKKQKKQVDSDDDY